MNDMNNDMNKEDTGIEPVQTRWFIDLDWYHQSNRSFPALVEGYLCPKCRGKLKGEITAEALLTSIKGCCGKSSDFISAGLPILESVFRIFLANGNQPLDLEEVGKQMRLRWGGDTYCISTEVLSRLLQSDRYYGLRQVPD